MARGYRGATERNPGGSEEHTSELQSPCNLVCRLLLEKKTAACWHGRTFSATRCQPGGGRRCSAGTRQLLAPPGIVRARAAFFFFFNHSATPGIFPLSLPDALPI